MIQAVAHRGASVAQEASESILLSMVVRVPVSAAPRKRVGFSVAFNNWMVNEGKQRIFFLLFILSQLVYFGYSFYVLNTATNLTVFRSVLSYGLPTARGAANVLNYLCGLILFTVCRNLISALRVSFLGRIIPVILFKLV